MSQKDYYFKKIRESETAKREKGPPYDPAAMDCESMPTGCWVWIWALGFVALLGLIKIVSVVH